MIQLTRGFAMPQRPLLSLTALFLLIGGCAVPPLVRTREELANHVGQKVSVEGTYEIGDNGEYVRGQDVEVGLDINPDMLGFGRSPLTNGLPVRASGKVDRGAMSLGIFIDAQTLAASRGRAEHPLQPGFVLRDAKVERIAGATTQPSATGSK